MTAWHGRRALALSLACALVFSGVVPAAALDFIWRPPIFRIDIFPPKVTALSATPSTVSATGGKVTVQATFDDASLPVSAQAILTPPGGGTPLKAGFTVTIIATSLSADPGSSGLSVTASATESRRASLSVPAGAKPGRWLLSVVATDTAGNGKTYSSADLAALGFPSGVTVESAAVGEDLIPPETYAEGLPEPGMWASSSVTVTLTATDNEGSGVAKKFYQLDEAAPKEYTGPFTISTDGMTILQFWSVDNAGNTEDPQVAEVGIDRTAPLLSVEASATYEGAAVVVVNASDALSGLYGYEWSLDGGEALGEPAEGATLQTGIEVTEPGQHTLRVAVWDLALNMTVVDNITFTVSGDGDGEEPPVGGFSIGVTGFAKGKPRVIGYGAKVAVTGTLAGPEGETAERLMALVRLDPAGGDPEFIGEATTDNAGRFTFSATLPHKRARTSYQVLFDAGDGNDLVASRELVVLPKARITLSAPPKARKDKATVVRGAIAPAHKAGSKPVLVRFERQVRNSKGKLVWKKWKELSATAAKGTSSSKLSVKVTFPSSGTWRYRARLSPKDTDHASMTTRWKSMSVAR